MLEPKLKPVDYSRLNLHTIKTPEYRHVFLVLYWVFFLLLFFVTEKLVKGPYTVMHCAVDDWVPFCEVFVIPYLLWFPFWIGMLAYGLFFDVPVFKKFTYYLMLVYSLSILICILFPNCQDMRPDVMPRKNVFTWILTIVYAVDTPTNVCPSMHVSGAIGVFFAARHSKFWNTRGRRIRIALMAVLICISTLFIKQHSFIDMVCALPMSALGWWVCFRKSD